MYAVIPPLLTEAGLWMAYVVGFFAFFGALVKWVIVPLFLNPLGEWFEERNLKPALDPIMAKLDETNHLITYHLGTNGNTPPLRDRMLLVEESVRNIKEDVLEVKEQSKKSS